MPRILLLLIVACLGVSASGANALVRPEPCGLDDRVPAQDGECPPTCAVCGCCSQPLVPALGVVSEVAANPTLPHALSPERGILPFSHRDVFHVPKSVLR